MCGAVEHGILRIVHVRGYCAPRTQKEIVFHAMRRQAEMQTRGTHGFRQVSGGVAVRPNLGGRGPGDRQYLHPSARPRVANHIYCWPSAKSDRRSPDPERRWEQLHSAREARKAAIAPQAKLKSSELIV